LLYYEAALSRRKVILLCLLGLLPIILCVLPCLLPLNGPVTVDPSTPADPDGAFVQASDTRMYYLRRGRADLPVSRALRGRAV
jgi:hypothetical protein